MEIKIIGTKELQQALAKKQMELHRAIARGVTKGAMLVQKTARQKILKGPKTGRVYGTVADVMNNMVVQALGSERQKRLAAAKVHQASAPGQPPANDTGKLAASIQVVAASPSNRATAYVTVGEPYGKHLEFGTKEIEPRPFLQPSADENHATIHAMIVESVNEAVGR